MDSMGMCKTVGAILLLQLHVQTSMFDNKTHNFFLFDRCRDQGEEILRERNLHNEYKLGKDKLLD